jgi:acyl transferase domain-containing protein/non-ribosomal peptide synthetase component F
MSQTEIQGSDIAVIGLAGRFPKASNIETFWQNLRNGVEGISLFSDDELKHSGAKLEPNTPNFVKARGVLDNADKFDGDFFGINPKEAEIMDPQHRVFLECAWEALEDAGYAGKQGEKLIGVYAGMSMNTYLLNNIYTRPDVVDLVGGYQIMIGNDKDYLPTRVSYKLNLRGPSVNVQTACSTSLVAVCVACEQLLNLQCDMALAGGVSVTFPQKRGYTYQEGGIASPDGHCRAFDADAKGTVSGDGAGIVLLKRLADAIADGDHIYAVIKGFATNNDGSLKAGYTAPSPDGQAEVIALAQGVAGVDPATIGYVVAHGTGTPLGDPIEIEGLTKAFRAGTEARQYCAITSVKTNIGHLDAAAGIAGLINAILAVYHGEIPANLHFQKPNPKIDFSASPFFVNVQLRKWPESQDPRRAGVSSFGIGGTNAHVVIEQAPPRESSGSAGPNLLLLSAKSGSALETATDRLCTYFKQNQELELADAAYTLALGRSEFEHRRALVCRDVADAAAALQAKDTNRVFTGTAHSKRTVAFMFPGQGAQYLNMGAELYRTQPVFLDQMDTCAELLRPHLGFDLREAIYAGSASTQAAAERLTQTSVAQPALFVIEYALAKLWMSWGVMPQALIGHSIGEYTAACVAGVFTLKEALALVAERGRLMQSMPPGAMLAVRLPEREVQPFLSADICAAAINSPANTVLSGTHDAIEALAAQLSAKGISAQKLHTSHAFHSSMMEPARNALLGAAERIHLRAPRIPFISNLTGTWITPEQATDPVYWASHLRQPVRFADGISELLKTPNLFALETGPGRTLSTFARQTITQVVSATSLPRTKADEPNEYVSLLNAAGQMWIHGVELDWKAFYQDGKRRRVPLPTYPFEQKRYWIEPGHLVASQPPVPVSPSSEPDAASGTEGATKPSVAKDSVAGSLVTLFSQLSGLRPEAIDPQKNFTELGFDSLFLTQVSQTLEKQFGVKVPFNQLLDRYSTLALLEKHLEEEGPPTATSKAAAAGSATATADSSKQSNRAPLTDAQKEIWFAAQHGDEASCVYNESHLLYLTGALDIAALRSAIQFVVERHESLRTIFSADGEYQEVQPELQVSIPLIDWSDRPEQDQRAALESVLLEEARQPFNLTKGPLLRCRLLQLQEEKHAFLICIHHLVCDGASFGIILRESAEAYNAGKRGIPCAFPTAPQYRTYAQKQKALEGTSGRTHAEQYWLRQYATLPPGLELPLDFARTRETGFSGGWEHRPLKTELCHALSRFSALEKGTLFQTFLAAYYVFLHRLTGQEEIVVGVPAAERSGEGDEKLVGHCVNFLPLRSQVRGETRFVDYLASLRSSFMEAYAHQSCTFGTLVQKLKLPRDRSRPPLVSATFNMVWVRSALKFAGLESELKSNPYSFSNFELTFNITETDGAFSLDCSYQSELLTRETVARWITYFETMLESIASNPEQTLSRLALIPESEREQLLATWSNSTSEFPRTTLLHQLFQEQAQESPNAVAIACGERKWRYGELDALAERFALGLQKAGTTPAMPAAVCGEVSVEMLAACLGVLKRGAALVALEGKPDSPWNKAVIEQVAILAAPEKDRPRWFQGQFIPLETAFPAITGERPGTPTLAPESPAVLVPTGCASDLHLTAYSHRALVNAVCWLAEHSRVAERASTLQIKRPGTERFFHELFLTWSTGGTLSLAEPAALDNSLTERISREKPERIFLSDAQLTQWDNELDGDARRPETLREVIIHATKGPKALLQLRGKLERCSFLVLYGGVQTGIVTAYPLNGANLYKERIPVGRPISNVQAFILDSGMNPVPPGVPGRLFIGGDTIAGNRSPEAKPFKSGKRNIIETGDLARHLPDGNIEIVRNSPGNAQLDDWIIDLIALEKALVQHGAVKEVAVIVREEAARPSLVAYIVASGNVTEQRIEGFLRHQLPSANVGLKVVLLSELPRTTTHQIDYTQLQEPRRAETTVNLPVAPRTATEKLVAEIWCDLIGLEEAGVHDNFFDLGGHSVLVTQVVARLRKVFDLEVGMRTIFERPTIAELAETIESMLIEQISSLSEEEAQRLNESGISAQHVQ